MARVSKKISELADAGALHGDEYVPIVKQGIDYRTTTRVLAGLGSAAFYGAITISRDPPSGGHESV